MKVKKRNWFSSAIIPIIIINIAVFIIQMMTQGTAFDFTSLFALKQGDLFSAPYTLITSMFMHAGVFHIFINMFILFMFGSILEQRIGTKRFLMLYFASGILAGIVANFIYPAAIGASGAVMGIVGAVIYLMPNMMVLLFFFLPMPLWVAGILIALIELFGAFGILGGQVANVSHLIGMVTGLGYGYYLSNQKKKFHRKFQRSSHLSDDEIEEYLKNGRI